MARPISIPKYIETHLKDQNWFLTNVETIREKVKALRGDVNDLPSVTIVIPAFNEEKTILRTISSLSETVTDKKVEILIVDNNSSDKTKQYVLKTGVQYVFEGQQGVKNARTTGLHTAKGEYIINADADTIYSPFWVDLLVDPLIKNNNIACNYGRFSFIPEPGYRRLNFFLYELLGDSYKRINAALKDAAIYVYGCSSAYRKQQAMDVNGYEHPPGSNEDGYLGLKLRDKFGKLNQVRDKKALAWTSSRKFIADGSLLNRLFKKLKISLNQ